MNISLCFRFIIKIVEKKPPDSNTENNSEAPAVTDTNENGENDNDQPAAKKQRLSKREMKKIKKGQNKVSMPSDNDK